MKLSFSDESLIALVIEFKELRERGSISGSLGRDLGDYWDFSGMILGTVVCSPIGS
jgi:hypothetical protein